MVTYLQRRMSRCYIGLQVRVLAAALTNIITDAVDDSPMSTATVLTVILTYGINKM